MEMRTFVSQDRQGHERVFSHIWLPGEEVRQEEGAEGKLWGSFFPKIESGSDLIDKEKRWSLKLFAANGWSSITDRSLLCC